MNSRRSYSYKPYILYNPAAIFLQWIFADNNPSEPIMNIECDCIQFAAGGRAIFKLLCFHQINFLCSVIWSQISKLASLIRLGNIH